MCDVEDREYLIASYKGAHVPAYDNHVYTDADDFQILRSVLKSGIILDALNLELNGSQDSGFVLFDLVYQQKGDIATMYCELNPWVQNIECHDENEDEGDEDDEDDIELMTSIIIKASQRGYVEVVEALIATGADVNAANHSGCTPILEASCFGHLEIVQALIAAGADVNRASNQDSTPISWASQKGHLEVVRALIAAGADVNKADNDGRTPIFIASSEGHPEVVQALIAAGADVNKADNNGITPILVASQEGHLEVASVLEAAAGHLPALPD